MSEQMDKANKVVDILAEYNVIDDLRKFQYLYGDDWRHKISMAHIRGDWVFGLDSLYSVFRIVRNNVGADPMLFPDMRGT